jgi:hypothetical protein
MKKIISKQLCGFIPDIFTYDEEEWLDEVGDQVRPFDIYGLYKCLIDGYKYILIRSDIKGLFFFFTLFHEMIHHWRRITRAPEVIDEWLDKFKMENC